MSLPETKQWVYFTMMMKSFFAVSATAVMIAGAAAATTVTGTWDVFVTSNNNTDTGMQDALYVDPVNAAGTLSFSFDSGDALDNGNGTSAVFLDGLSAAFNLFPSSFDLSLTLGGVMQTWTSADFLLAEVTVDNATTDVTFADFLILTEGPSASIADPNIIDITPAPGASFLRFDAAGAITGIDIEIQTQGVAPVPVPASLPLLATGALLLGALRRKSKKS